MPMYTYYCPGCDIEQVRQYRMGEAPNRTECETCGEFTFRQWRMPAVNWGGIPPSAGGHSPAVQQLLNEAEAGRDAYAQEHEDHERRTANDNNNRI